MSPLISSLLLYHWLQSNRLPTRTISISIHVTQVDLEATKGVMPVARKMPKVAYHQMYSITFKMHQIRFWLELHIGPHWGSSRCSLRTHNARLGKLHTRHHGLVLTCIPQWGGHKSIQIFFFNRTTARLQLYNKQQDKKITTSLQCLHLAPEPTITNRGYNLTCNV